MTWKIYRRRFLTERARLYFQSPLLISFSWKQYAYLDKESVPASVLEEEKAILIKQMEQDPKMAGKPQQVLEKIVEGKLGKYYENNCLLEQAYVKDDSMSVSKYVASVAKALGGSIKVTGYVRFDKGEGLEKREEDFAAEIAKMVQG